ncbi:THAP domain containing 9 [Mactra antiquata]
MSCFVTCCRSWKGSKFNRGLSFHQFPKDSEMRQKWLSAIQTHERQCCDNDFVNHDREVFTSTKVCSLHFTEWDYELNRNWFRKDSVPSRWNHSVKKRKLLPFSETDGNQQAFAPATEKLVKFVVCFLDDVKWHCSTTVITCVFLQDYCVINV